MYNAQFELRLEDRLEDLLEGAECVDCCGGGCRKGGVGTGKGVSGTGGGGGGVGGDGVAKGQVPDWGCLDKTCSHLDEEPLPKLDGLDLIPDTYHPERSWLKA